MKHPGMLAEWFAAHAPAMKLYARQWVDSAAAEDVVHDVFVRLLAGPVEPREPKAWLFAAVRNAAISEARSSTRRGKRNQLLAQQRQEWFESKIDDLADAGEVESAMKTLSQASREFVVLRIWGEMSFAEIAKLLGAPLSTVFDQYRAALETIRKTLESTCKTKMK